MRHFVKKAFRLVVISKAAIFKFELPNFSGFGSSTRPAADRTGRIGEAERRSDAGCDQSP